MNEKEQFKDLVIMINEELSQNIINKLSDAINNQEIDPGFLKKIKSFRIEADPEYCIYPVFTMKSGYKKADMNEEDLEDFLDVISGAKYQVKYNYNNEPLMTQYENFKERVQVDFLIRCGKMNFNPSSDNYFEKVITSQFEKEKKEELDSKQSQKVKPKV